MCRRWLLLLLWLEPGIGHPIFGLKTLPTDLCLGGVLGDGCLRFLEGLAVAMD